MGPAEEQKYRLLQMLLKRTAHIFSFEFMHEKAEQTIIE